MSACAAAESARAKTQGWQLNLPVHVRPLDPTVPASVRNAVVDATLFAGPEGLVLFVVLAHELENLLHGQLLVFVAGCMHRIAIEAGVA